MHTWAIGSEVFSMIAGGCSVAISGVILISDDIVAFPAPKQMRQ